MCALLHHRSPGFLNEVPGAPQVDIQDPVPARVSDLEEGDEIGDAGDLNCGIQMTVVLNRQLNRFADILAAADVTDDRFHPPARLADGLGGLLEHVALDVEHDHPGALGCERFRHCSPYALGGAGDDDAFTRESTSLIGAHEINPP